MPNILIITRQICAEKAFRRASYSVPFRKPARGALALSTFEILYRHGEGGHPARSDDNGRCRGPQIRIVLLKCLLHFLRALSTEERRINVCALSGVGFNIVQILDYLGYQ